MPAILEKKDEETWLNPDETKPDRLLPLLHPYPALPDQKKNSSKQKSLLPSITSWEESPKKKKLTRCFYWHGLCIKQYWDFILSARSKRRKDRWHCSNYRYARRIRSRFYLRADP